MTEDELSNAIALNKSGKKIEAREILRKILHDDPMNERAWMWLADTYPDTQNRIAVLEECLAHNPNNEHAQKWLATVKLKHDTKVNDAWAKETNMTNSELEIRNNEKPSQNKKSKTGILVTITILLALLLAVEIYQVVTTYQQNKLAEERASAYQTRVEEAQLLVSKQQTVIFGLLTDYQKDAYGGSVDRIAEQQLIATEYTLTALQIMAIQNSQIIELLANAP